MWNSGFPTPDKYVSNKKQTNEYLCGGLWTISKTFQGDRQGLLLYLRNVFAMRVAWKEFGSVIPEPAFAGVSIVGGISYFNC